MSGDSPVSLLVDVSGSLMAVTASLKVPVGQTGLLFAGVGSDGIVRYPSIDANRAIVVTGSFTSTPTGTQAITGTVNLDRGNASALPLFITGTVGIGGPEGVIVSNTVTVSGSFGTTDASGRQIVVGAVQSGSTAQGNPVLVSGTDTSNIVRTLSTDATGRVNVSITSTGSIPVFIVGGATSTVTGTVNLDRGNNNTLPLFITGTVGIGGPEGVTVSNTVTVSGSFGTQDVSGKQLIVGQVQSGSTIQGNPVTVSGTDTNSVVRTLLTDTSGRLTITGSVGIGGPVSVVGSVVSTVTGTLNLDRGNSGAVPLFITGTVGIGGPEGVIVSNVVTVTTTGSLPVVIVGSVPVTGTVNLDRGNTTSQPLFISGSVGVGGPLSITGVVSTTTTGTVNLDRGNTTALPLFISGSVGIGGPITVVGLVTSAVTGTINLDRGNISSAPLFITGTVGIGGPEGVVVSNVVAITSTGSLAVAVLNTVVSAVTGTVNLDRGNAIATPLFVSGTVGIGGPVSVVGTVSTTTTGTVNLDRGNNNALPLFITGTVGIGGPEGVIVSNVVSITSTGSLPVVVVNAVSSAVTGTVNLDRGNTTATPLFVSGSVGIGGPITVTGTVTSTVTGTVNLDRGNTNTLPLFITGTVGIGGPEGVTVSNTVSVSGSFGAQDAGGRQLVSGQVQSGSTAQGFPVIIAGTDASNIARSALTDTSGRLIITGSVGIGAVTIAGSVSSAVTGTINLDRGNTTAVPLFVSGSVGIGGPVTVVGTVSTTTTGTVNLDRGNNNSLPLFITGTVGIGGPEGVTVSNTVTVSGSFGTTDASGRQVVVGSVQSGSTAQGNPVSIAGIDNTNIVRPVLVDNIGRVNIFTDGLTQLNVAGSVVVTGTVNLDRGNTIAVPLFVTGNVGIGLVQSGSTAQGFPVLFAGTTSAGTVKVPQLDVSGSLNITPSTTPGSNVTSVAASATVVTLLSANAARRFSTFYNDSLSTAYLKLGATASTTSFTVRLLTQAYYEAPPYNGLVSALWATATGSMRITELS